MHSLFWVSKFVNLLRKQLKRVEFSVYDGDLRDLAENYYSGHN